MWRYFRTQKVLTSRKKLEVNGQSMLEACTLTDIKYDLILRTSANEVAIRLTILMFILVTSWIEIYTNLTSSNYLNYSLQSTPNARDLLNGNSTLKTKDRSKFYFDRNNL